MSVTLTIYLTEMPRFTSLCEFFDVCMLCTTDYTINKGQEVIWTAFARVAEAKLLLPDFMTTNFSLICLGDRKLSREQSYYNFFLDVGLPFTCLDNKTRHTSAIYTGYVKLVAMVTWIDWGCRWWQKGRLVVQGSESPDWCDWGRFGRTPLGPSAGRQVSPGSPTATEARLTWNTRANITQPSLGRKQWDR